MYSIERPALRFAVDVAPEQFRVSMIRWAQATPDGGQIVFEALGKIWVKDLDSGEQHALTGVDDRLEYYPVLSPDGRSVVFVTWDDEELGSVRIISLAGRGERAVTRQPGHYIEPAFSADGKLITYRKIEGEWRISSMKLAWLQLRRNWTQ